LKYYFFAAAGVGEGAGVAADDGRDHVPSIPITIVVAVHDHWAQNGRSSNIAEGSSRNDPGVGGCRCPRGGGKESGSLSNRLLMPTLAMMQSKARFRIVLVAREGVAPGAPLN